MRINANLKRPPSASVCALPNVYVTGALDLELRPAVERNLLGEGLVLQGSGAHSVDQW